MHSALQCPPEITPARQHGSPWTLPEVALHVRLSLATVERRVRSGELPSFKIGARRLVADAVVRALASGEPPPAAAV